MVNNKFDSVKNTIFETGRKTYWFICEDTKLT